MDAESFKEHCMENPSHLVAFATGYIALQRNVSELQKKLAKAQSQKVDGVGDGALERVEVENHALQNRVAQLESDNTAKDLRISVLEVEVQGQKDALEALASQVQQLVNTVAFGDSLILRRSDYDETDAKLAVAPKSGGSDQGYFGGYTLNSSGSNVSSVSSDRHAGSDVKRPAHSNSRQPPTGVDPALFAAGGVLEHRMADVEDKVAHVQRQVQHLTDQSQQKLERDSMKRELHNIHDQVHSLDNRLIQYSNMMEEMSLRQELQEVKTTGGVFVWKINEVQRRYREAMEGKTLSLYSPPFYTSPHGYRMCIRTYLYGDGTGKGSHISVFFVIMKSEHDQLLSWPFKQKVTISLLNQDTPAEQFSHITETFLPDSSSSSFQKPESEMNVASGFPKFVKKSVLKDPRFVKGDTMYLRVRVDRTGLIPE